MPVLYFDTNVFDHIHKGIYLTNREHDHLLQKIKSKEVRIQLSLLNIEEIFLYYHQNPNDAKEQLDLIKNIADWNHLIKYPEIILKNDIIDFSNGKSPDSPYLSDKDIKEKLLDTLKNPEKYKLNIDRIINEVQDERNIFYHEIRQAKKEVMPSWKDFRGEIPKFEKYLHDECLRFTEGFITDKKILKRCRKIGIDKLFQIKSVYLNVSISLSLIYSQIFEKREPNIGDAFDLRHTVAAYSSDVFVLNDMKFKRILDRIPNKPYKVSNLKGLFDII